MEQAGRSRQEDPSPSTLPGPPASRPHPSRLGPGRDIRDAAPHTAGAPTPAQLPGLLSLSPPDACPCCWGEGDAVGISEMPPDVTLAWQAPVTATQGHLVGPAPRRNRPSPAAAGWWEGAGRAGGGSRPALRGAACGGGPGPAGRPPGAQMDGLVWGPLPWEQAAGGGVQAG